MRLIDADALMKDVRENSESYFADDFAEFWVNRQPTIHPEPHWIPCSERLPKEEGFYLVTLAYKHGAETNIRFFKIESGEGYWSLWGNENITAWMPKPIPYKEVTE